MTTLDDLLALLPDNDTGEIDAADLRTIVTAIWGEAATGFAVSQSGYQSLDARLIALETNPESPTVTVSGRWQINNQAGATPGGQQVTCNDGAFGDATTWLRFATQSQQNVDMTYALSTCISIYMQQESNANAWVRFEVIGTATINAGYVQIPVDRVSGTETSGAAWQAAVCVFEVPYA